MEWTFITILLAISLLITPGITVSSWKPVSGDFDLSGMSVVMIAPFSEKYCFDRSIELCRNHGGYFMRYSVFDPVSGSCVCSTKPSKHVVPKICPDTSCESSLDSVFYWPSTEECFCEAKDYFSQSWNTAEANKASRPIAAFPAEHYPPVKAKWDALISFIMEAKAVTALPDLKSRISALHILNEKFRKENNLTAHGSTVTSSHDSTIAELGALKEVIIDKRQAASGTATAPAPADTAVPTFIPPPKTNINPQLVNESLKVQPQDKAIISSVNIHIMDEVITFLFQMDGFIADSIPVNASTSMACGSIGVDPEPDIQIVPKFVRQGQGSQQTLVADCRCIAVNMYNPNVINFYIQTSLGKIYSLTGSNKLVDINKLDTSQPLAVSLVSIPSGSQKRDVSAMTNILPLKSRQALSVKCGQPCPFAFMTYVESKDAGCGCIFKGTEHIDISKRAISTPDMYSATMSKAACDAITCIDNGGKHAMFNPYTATCWCVVPPLIEDNPSGWTPST